ncbi:MAG: NAD(P)H-hydrate dehydratase, partial [Anaerolineales bacterium]
ALAMAGAQVAAYVVLPRAETDKLVARLAEKGLLVARADQDQRSRVLKNLLSSGQIVIDAILGTGARLPLPGPVADVLSTVQGVLEERRDRPFIVAVDCPSGADCDTGALAPETLAADVTISLAAPKIGLLNFPAVSKIGELVVADIGVPRSPDPEPADELVWAGSHLVRGMVPLRPRTGHKGTFGSVLIVAGSINYPGAAELAARAAYRIGAGLVTIAAPAPLQVALAGALPEATWLLLPHEMGVTSEGAAEVLGRKRESYEAVVFGPGLGVEDTTAAFVQRFFALSSATASGGFGFVQRPESAAVAATPMPACVLDADGLRLLSRFADWPARVPAGTVLTPHPGEMAALTGLSVEEIQADRIAVARRFAKLWKCVVVLKGAYTVVASGTRACVIPFASTALAHAGTGDVLAGAIGGLIAQRVESFSAATLGAFAHGWAAELAALDVGSERGVLASEVANHLPRALEDLARRPS